MRDDKDEKHPATKPVEKKAEPPEKPERHQDTEDGDNPLICRGSD